MARVQVRQLKSYVVGQASKGDNASGEARKLHRIV